MSDLAARFARLADSYETRKREATAAVEVWDWFTGPGLDPRPLHFARNLSRPGRRLGTRPPPDRDVLRIGFDNRGARGRGRGIQRVPSRPPALRDVRPASR